MDSKSIEAFFLNTLLKLATAGVFIITVVDFLFYPDDRLSIIIDLVVLGTCLISYALRQHSPGISMLIFTSVILTAMVYQSLAVPLNTTISLSIILLDGFIVSVMLKGNYKVVMHTLIVSSVIVIFVVQFITPTLRFTSNPNEMLTIVVTYLIVYFNLAYPAAVLKNKYDLINQHLSDSNDALIRKTSDMSEQNAELLQAQSELNSLNSNLEQILHERTAKIMAQNEQLVRYSYNNAHHLRGPVARLLGLAAIYKIDAEADADFIIAKMLDQAHEIDAVVRLINEDLEAQDFTIH
jgi:signal transduction histidine kinase